MTTTEALTARPATSPADHRVTLAQIGRGVLMSCGARNFVHDDPNGIFYFQVGSRTVGKVCKITVVLCADDTYRVEYGYMINRTGPRWGEWVNVEAEDGIYAEDLARTVRRMGDRDRY